MGKKRDAKAAAREAERVRLSVIGRPIGDVGIHTVAGLACPICHGTQFEAGRSGGNFLLGRHVPVAADRVACVTCGAVYMRGATGRRPAAPAAATAPMSPGITQPAGWYADPLKRYAQRWWGGVSWTSDVIDKKGRQSQDAKGL